MISDWVIFWTLMLKIWEKKMMPNTSVTMACVSSMNFPHLINFLGNRGL